MPVPLAIAIVVGTIVLGSGLFILFARRSPEGGREDRTPTNVYAVTAGAMSLLIAFTMSMTFDNYSGAQRATHQEAGQLLAMSRAATFMPAPTRDALRDQLVCYIDAVAQDEWPSMRRGSSTAVPSVRDIVSKMDAILAQNPTLAGPGVSLWENANTDRSDARIERLLLAKSFVPPLLWVLLILGSIITIGSLFVVADRSKPGWGHALVIVGPLFIASTALVVIAFFSHPYEATPGGVSPEPLLFAKNVITTEHMGDVPVARCGQQGAS